MRLPRALSMRLPANRILDHFEGPKLHPRTQYSSRLAQLPRRIPRAPKPFRNRAPAANVEFCIKKSSCAFQRGVTKNNASPDNNLRHFKSESVRPKIRQQYSPAILAGLPLASYSQRSDYIRIASTRRQPPAATSQLTTRHRFDKLPRPNRQPGLARPALRGCPGARSWQHSYFGCGDRQ